MSLPALSFALEVLTEQGPHHLRRGVCREVLERVALLSGVAGSITPLPTTQ